jgi:DNA-binding NtrC family response regulator
MPCSAEGRILVAGHTSPSTNFVIKQLEREGCVFQSVETVAEAESSLRETPFDIVLAGEFMPDGRGYDLTGCVVDSSATLLVAIAFYRKRVCGCRWCSTASVHSATAH